MLELILYIVFFWFLCNIIHEGSHALVGRYQYGLELIGFYPYPHMHGGRLYFARYTAFGNWPTGKYAWIHAAPIYADFVVIIPITIIALLIPLPLPLQVMMVCHTINTLVWVYGYHWGGSHTDGHKFRYGIQQDIPKS